MAETTKTYVIQTKAGKVVRVIRWKGTGTRAYVVLRLDTGRVELRGQLAELDQQNVAYETLNDVAVSTLDRSGVSISEHLDLKKVDTISHLDRNVKTPVERDEEKFQQILTWTGMGHLGVLALIFLIGWVIHPLIQPEEVVVKVVKQKDFVRPKFNRRTVKVSEKKIDRRTKVTKKRVVSRKVKPKKNTRITKKKPTRNKRGQSRSKVNIANTGALGVLGGLKNGSKKSSGLNVNALNNSRGSGVSGKGGAGGHRRAFPGKGLVASGIGNGGKAKGSGGYGTRGKGGGRAGYGKMSMAGSSGAYFVPLHEEALIQGGLDRESINAVIQKNMGQIVYCYEKGLQVDPKASGLVNVRFIIGGNGRVATAKVASSSVGSKKIDSCIINKLSGWKFPKPHGKVNVKVNYPFELRRLGQG